MDYSYVSFVKTPKHQGIIYMLKEQQQGKPRERHFKKKLQDVSEFHVILTKYFNDK